MTGRHPATRGIVRIGPHPAHRDIVVAGVRTNPMVRSEVGSNIERSCVPRAIVGVCRMTCPDERTDIVMTGRHPATRDIVRIGQHPAHRDIVRIGPHPAHRDIVVAGVRTNPMVGSEVGSNIERSRVPRAIAGVCRMTCPDERTDIVMTGRHPATRDIARIGPHPATRDIVVAGVRTNPMVGSEVGSNIERSRVPRAIAGVCRMTCPDERTDIVMTGRHPATRDIVRIGQHPAHRDIVRIGPHPAHRDIVVAGVRTNPMVGSEVGSNIERSRVPRAIAGVCRMTCPDERTDNVMTGRHTASVDSASWMPR